MPPQPAWAGGHVIQPTYQHFLHIIHSYARFSSITYCAGFSGITSQQIR